jgi:hypothetical protein
LAFIRFWRIYFPTRLYITIIPRKGKEDLERNEIQKKTGANQHPRFGVEQLSIIEEKKKKRK